MQPHDPRTSDRPRRPNRPEIRAVRRELAPVPVRRSRPWLLGGAAAVAILALLLLGWLTSLETGGGEPSPLVTVKNGTVEESLEIDALVIRQEQVVVSRSAGTVRRLAAEGERVRIGMPVVAIGPAGVGASESSPPTPPATRPGSANAEREYDRLTGEIFRLAVAVNQAKYAGESEKATALEEQLDQLARQQATLIGQDGDVTRIAPIQLTVAQPADPLATEIQAETGGMILYEVDGLEAILTPDAADNWSVSWLRSLPYPDQNEIGKGTVSSGQPLFKIVRDTDLELVAIVPAARLTEARRTLIQEEGLTLRLAGGQKKLSARVRAIKPEGEELLLHLTVPLPSSETLKVRRLRTTLLLEVFEGIVVPRSAIDIQNGLQGVWVYESGSYRFAPVRVAGGNAQEVAVTGELSPGSQVLCTPPPPGS